MLLRVSARCIIVRDRRLLVQLSKHGDFYRLPGGRVRVEESILQGLQREIREELGIEKIGEPRLLYIVDSFYRRRNGVVHEIGFYFLCKDVDVDAIKPKEEHLKVKWVEFEEITPETLRPSALAAYLKELGKAETINGGRWPVYIINVDVGEE